MGRNSEVENENENLRRRTAARVYHPGGFYFPYLGEQRRRLAGS